MLALSPFGLTARSTAAPRDVDVFTGGYNRDDVRAVEIPSANGIGTARAVAQLYGDATGGAALGLTDDTVEALCAPAVEPSGSVRDKVLNIDTAFSLGMSKPLEKFVSSSGRSGRRDCWSFGFADPDTGVGFCMMNRIGFHLLSDPRELALRQAPFRDVLGCGRRGSSRAQPPRSTSGLWNGRGGSRGVDLAGIADSSSLALTSLMLGLVSADPSANFSVGTV